MVYIGHKNKRLLYRNFHIIPHINPRHSYINQRAEGRGLICASLVDTGVIWKLTYY